MSHNNKGNNTRGQTAGRGAGTGRLWDHTDTHFPMMPKGMVRTRAATSVLHSSSHNSAVGDGGGGGVKDERDNLDETRPGAQQTNTPHN